MAEVLRHCLIRQFEISWSLALLHLEQLTTEECLWRPADRGLHVHQTDEGTWCADWPEHEGYGIGPSSIAWLTWHMGFWWSMTLDHSCGAGTLVRERVTWPGPGDEAVRWLIGLQQEWREVLDRSSDDDLRSTERSRWPLEGCPWGDIVAWVNVELMKNAAEIGYARFLYAVRAT